MKTIEEPAVAFRQLNARIPSRLHEEVKIAAIQDKMNLEDWVAAALAFYKARRQSKPKSASFAVAPVTPSELELAAV